LSGGTERGGLSWSWNGWRGGRGGGRLREGNGDNPGVRV